MEHRIVNIDGVDLAYVRRGRGQPLMLVHGYPLDHRIWDDVASLLESDFDLILPDMRGFGESQVMQADQSIMSYAADLRGLLDHLHIRQAVVAGHSMGGYVALAFARQFPKRLSGLGLVSSQTLADTPERRDGRYATAKEVMESGVTSVADAMAPKLSADAGVQAILHQLILDQPSLGVASALRAMADRPDSTGLLKVLELPMVIVHGQADGLIPIERAREMKEAAPSAHYVELPQAGHMPMMEDAPSVAEALRFFRDKKAKRVRLIDS
jgi:pimeloyl-ACP methyl ester carboxylesterase